MSYSRTFHGSVSLSVHYSYPPSEHGGNGSKTVTEPITITVVVDDAPFIRSAAVCTESIDDVASSLIEAANRNESAKITTAEKISSSVTNGFYNYTKADFSQKMVELENEVSAAGPKLLTYFDQLKSIKERMENDFNMIKKRYVDIFSSLDDELYREVNRLYSPCFDLIDDCFNKLIVSSSLLSLSEVLGYNELTVTENALLLSFLKLKLSGVMKLLSRIAENIKHLDSVISAVCEKKNANDTITLYVPAIFFQREMLTGGNSEIVTYAPSIASDEAQKKIRESVQLSASSFQAKPREMDLVEMKFQEMMAGMESAEKRKKMMALWQSYKGGN